MSETDPIGSLGLRTRPEIPDGQMCESCGRKEVEHDGTERHGCLVFWPLGEPVESWHYRNEQAKRPDGAA